MTAFLQENSLSDLPADAENRLRKHKYYQERDSLGSGFVREFDFSLNEVNCQFSPTVRGVITLNRVQRLPSQRVDFLEKLICYAQNYHGISDSCPVRLHSIHLEWRDAIRKFVEKYSK